MCQSSARLSFSAAEKYRTSPKKLRVVVAVPSCRPLLELPRTREPGITLLTRAHPSTPAFFISIAPPRKKKLCVDYGKPKSRRTGRDRGGSIIAPRKRRYTHTQSHRRICIHLYIHTADLGFGFSGRLDTLGFAHRRRIAIAIGGIECTCVCICVDVGECDSVPCVSKPNIQCCQVHGFPIRSVDLWIFSNNNEE